MCSSDLVRAGAIVPRQPLVQSTAETPDGPLELDVYPGDDCGGTLYADDGHSMAYQGDGYARQTVRCTVTDKGISVTFGKRQGSFAPWWKAVRVVVHGWQGKGSATLGNNDVPASADAANETISATIAPATTETTVTFAKD